MPGATVVKAIYDYSRKHTDELSFRKGDVIIVSQQVDGGWWEGVLNGSVGWFPSNYVSLMQAHDDGRFSSVSDSHLHAFQNEIVQHILEGEVRQVNELNQLYSQIIVNLEPFYHLPFIDKLSRMRDLIRQAAAMHQNLAYSLDEMRQSSEAKQVGKLFLEMASTVNSIGCDYSKIHLYVIIGMDKYCDAISRHLSGKCGITFQLDRCKQQLFVVFDRLGRYPLLLREMERYLEVPHPDREDIRQAILVYGEITERCAILRKFKEYDINILLSTINGWQGKSIDKLGDPILTLHVVLLKIDYDHQRSDSRPVEEAVATTMSGSRPSVIIIFPSSVLLLARTKKQSVYEFTTRIPVNCLKVISCRDNEKYLDLIVSSVSTSEVDCKQPSRVSLDCNDENARDLLVSTLNDLIQYQTQLDRVSLVDPNVVGSGSGGDRGLREACREGQLCRRSEEKTAPLSPSTGETNKLGLSGDKLLRPSNAAPVTTTATTTAVAVDPQGREAEGQQSRTSLLPPAPPCGGFPPAVEANLPPDTRDSSQPTRLAGQNEQHLIPHRIQTGALVRWPWEAVAADTSQRVKEENTDGQLPANALRCLRLDCPTGVTPATTSGYDPHHPVPFTDRVRGSGAGSATGDHVSPPGAAARPGSPLAGVESLTAAGAGGSREIRRKRSDRQKSAVNPDEVLRSVSKLQENERRNADATKILQVVEAYCASAWSQHGFHVGDRNQANFCVPLSPTESRTLRQQLISSQAPHRAGDKTEQHQPVASSRPLSERLLGDSFAAHSSGQKNPSSNAPSRSSLVSSASAIVHRVAKRSGSKSKADSVPSPQLASSTTTPATSSSSGPQTSTGVQQCAGSANRLMPASSNDTPAAQTLLPPPVILPTRGGRRRV